jgi:AraC-like DNA-binding protein
LTSHDRNDDGVRQPTQWARVATRLVTFVTQEGVDPAPLLDAADLAGLELGDPNLRVPLVAAYDLLEAIDDALARDPSWPLRFTRSIGVEDMDAVGFLMLTSATFGEGLEKMLAYMRVWNDGERYGLEVGADAAHLTYTGYGSRRRAHALLAEIFVFDVVKNGASLVPDYPPPLYVGFRHAARAPEDVYLEAFGTRPRFGAPIDEAVLPRAALALPMPHANAAMNAYFERHARALTATIPGEASWVERVRPLVAEHLVGGPPSLASIAARLRMSPRTLQRKLHAEALTFQELVEEVRRQRALAYVEARLATGEIAYLLGYSEASAFHRAFRRWTGTSPERFRAGPSARA